MYSQCKASIWLVEKWNNSKKYHHFIENHLLFARSPSKWNLFYFPPIFILCRIRFGEILNRHKQRACKASRGSIVVAMFHPIALNRLVVVYQKVIGMRNSFRCFYERCKRPWAPTSSTCWTLPDSLFYSHLWCFFHCWLSNQRLHFLWWNRWWKIFTGF